MFRFFDGLVRSINLKGTVVTIALLGSLGLAVLDKEQRNAFMTIAVTATGAYFGAEMPSTSRLKQLEKKDDNANDNK